MIVPAFERPLFPKMMGPILIAGEETEAGGGRGPAGRSGSTSVWCWCAPAPASLPQDPRQPTISTRSGWRSRWSRLRRRRPTAPSSSWVRCSSASTSSSSSPTVRCSGRACDYWHETGFETNEELKAYSVAVVDSIKELVKLNPLYKEGLSLILDRLDVHDPGVLADFAAAMTTASGEELQEILETRSIRKRIEQVLILLKKEIEISKLKAQISEADRGEALQAAARVLPARAAQGDQEGARPGEGGQADRGRAVPGAARQKLTLTDEARERIDEELEKLKLLEPSSPGVQRHPHLPRLADGPAVGRLHRGQLRPQARREHPRRRPLRPHGRQGPHPRVHLGRAS